MSMPHLFHNGAFARQGLRLLGIFILTAFLSSALAAAEANLDANGRLPRATPESQGVPSDAIAALVANLDQNIDSINGLMILRHGKVIYENYWKPFCPETKHAMYSMSKNFTSTAAGFAYDEGLLDINKPVIDFFPDELPSEISENLRKMKVRDILAMAGGHDKEPSVKKFIDLNRDPSDAPIQKDEDDWAKVFLAHPVDHEPGTTFLYNSLGSYMVSAIVQKLTGEKIVDYLKPRLFDPLHIDYPHWEMSPQGVNEGGSGLYLHLEDMAKFGQFYLQKGVWNGKQLLSSEWVEMATSKQVSNGTDPESDWAQGYGFQFWLCRHHAYRGAGAQCQFTVVLPDQEMVIASYADSNNYQGILNYYWELLPACQDASLPEDEKAQARLAEVGKDLRAQEGASGSVALESRVMESKILKRDMKYSVYLPAGYLTSGLDYPVLYLLHGLGGNETNWLNPGSGNLKEIADAWFKDHPLDKMVIVMPDALNSWYVNQRDGEFSYEDYFFQEFIPHIEKFYRIRSEKKYRAVVGISMGGHGALVLALKHPDMFLSSYAMSAAAWTEEGVRQMSYDDFARRFLKIFGTERENGDRITNYFRANWPQMIAASMPESQRQAVHFTLDCGDDDPRLFGNEALHRLMKSQGIPCELRVRDGEHRWIYWQTSLPDAFQFISDVRAQTPDAENPAQK